MEISVGLIIAYTLLLVLGLAGLVFCFSYYKYVKHRIFAKIKRSIIANCFLAFALVCFLTVAIFSIVDFVAIKKTAPILNIANISITCILILITIFYLLFANLLPIYINKYKLDYTKFESINFSLILKNLKDKNIDFNSINSKMKKSNLKYISLLEKEHKILLFNLEDKTKKLADKIAYIVCFNEQFATRWSDQNNNLQLLLTLEACSSLQQKSLQNS